MRGLALRNIDGAADDADIQNLLGPDLGSDPAREVERSTAGMTTGLFG